jgi:nicotinate-nucleotide adenylyltransferase
MSQAKIISEAKKTKKIGLFFGSFNPIHIGHMCLANYFCEYTDLKEIWFVVSPQNPLKPKTTLLADHHRLELVHLALDDHPKFKICDIEFKLPKPSYTIHTLVYLNEKYPDKQFVLLMGADNLSSFSKWKNYEMILKDYKLYVYPRHDAPISEWHHHPSFSLVDAPKMEISSTFIRKALKEKKEIPFFIPEKAYSYIKDMHFYEK